MAFKNLKS